MQCYKRRYIMIVLVYGPDKRAFYTRTYKIYIYIYTYVYSIGTIEPYARMYIYCTHCVHGLATGLIYSVVDCI